MDSKAQKAVIDLQEYLYSLGNDRPPVGVFLKALGIDPITMQDAVMSAAFVSNITKPDVCFEVVNAIFKIGITIGYKYAIKEGMERAFGMKGNENNEQPN